MSTLAYRSDIDGLRAIAVLSVVFFHFGIGPLHGGFVGVDIFFVISGYLITGIIHKEIDRNQFTFVGFYERRIRRIFPALFSMLMVVLPVGAWLLLPSDLIGLGNGTIATLLFGSNVLFWRQSGYFDTSSEYNPLLHTWSLAVEEQFYIGLPVLLIILHRFGRGSLKPLLLVCATASFALCVWMQPIRPTSTFFLSPFRAWELLLGSLLAVGFLPVINNRPLREVVSVAALVALLVSLLSISAGLSFPGWHAALPVVATAILLHTGSHGDSMVKHILSLRPLVLIGLISYSLYLWHWPLVVYARYHTGMEPLSPVMAWILLAVAILLATACYRWIETPFRRRSTRVTRKHLFAGASVAMAGIVAIALLTRLDEGWQRRFEPDVMMYDKARRPVIPFQECDGHAPDSTGSACQIGADGKASRVLLWGDSHALAWAPALDALGKDRQWKVDLAVNSACPPLLGVDNPINFKCTEFNRNTYKFLKRGKIDVIILIASWTSYSSPNGEYSIFDEEGRVGNAETFAPALQRTVHALAKHANNVVLIGPTPGAPSDIPFRMAMSRLFGAKTPTPISFQEFTIRADDFWKAVYALEPHQNLLIIDPSKWFCEEDSCKYFDRELGLLYRDAAHLSLAGANFVGKSDLLPVNR